MVAAANVPAGSRTLRAIGHVGKDMFRSNFVTLGYNLTRLTTCAKAFVMNKPADPHPGLNMKKQQSEWLTPRPASEVELIAVGGGAPVANEVELWESTLPLR
jgi:hypothetical protein